MVSITVLNAHTCQQCNFTFGSYLREIMAYAQRNVFQGIKNSTVCNSKRLETPTYLLMGNN